MPEKQTFELTNLPAAALLQAVAMPDNQQGMALALPKLKNYINACQHLWPTTPVSTWQSALADLEVQIDSRARSGGDLGAVYNKPNADNDLFSTFLKWERAMVPDSEPYKLDALLGRALMTSAAKHQKIPRALLTGLTTIKKTLIGKGSRSADWNAITTINLTNAEAVGQLKNTISRKSPTLIFLTALYQILEAAIIPPSVIATNVIHPLDPDRTSVDVNTLDNSRQGAEKKSTPLSEYLDKDKDKDEDSVPDIGARIKGADYTSFGVKLGLYHRDQMLINDLVQITNILASYLNSTNPLHIGYAALALTSLITGCSDAIALKLEFSPRLTIWLDLEKSCWAWDFQCYRSSHIRATAEWSASKIEPINIPLPVKLVEILAWAQKNNPTATNLGGLICSISKQEQIDLVDFRSFLRGCGSTAHPAYRGRFSRSLAAVYLEVTGSDMTSGLLTGQLAATAPAALFYFGPTRQLLTQRMSNVYQRLGIGAPAPFHDTSVRIACKKVLEIEVLQAGWAALVTDINQTRQHACSAISQHDILTHCNSLMPLLASAFVIQTAHRATRLENLTFGMLLIHPHAILIQDKDEDGRAQPRLIARTSTVNAILNIALECHQLIMKKLVVRGLRATASEGIDQPLFVQWKVTEGLTAQPISNGAIAEITKSHFGSEPNFGRCQWVTYMDEHGCDRWLIRGLTGHTRDVTRTSGSYLDIPPVVVAERLKAQMETISLKIFGEESLKFRNVKHLPQIIQVTPIIDKVRKLQDRVHDARILLPPISVETLIGWSATDLIRHKLMRGHIDAKPQILAVLHLIFVDQIPDATLCADAAANPDKYFRIYAHEQGIIIERDHFVHKTWIPIQPTTRALLAQVVTPMPSQHELKKQIESVIRGIHEVSWPQDSQSFWQALGDSTQAWRRLELAPSLNALSDLTVPTPCLSANSLRRLAGEKIDFAEAMKRSRYVPNCGRKNVEDGVKTIVSILGKYSSSVERFGEKRNRAIRCIKSIEGIQTIWSAMGMWLKEWILDELECTRSGKQGCYQISSLNTYLSTLLLANYESLQWDDPYEWEDGDWLTWIGAIDSHCSKDKPAQVEKSDNVSDRARSAICALVNSWIRRGNSTPTAVRAKLGLPSTAISAGGSTSSTLIMASDSISAMTLLNHWHRESPTELAMDAIRDLLSSSVPVRTSEISSLMTDCLTHNGGLIIKRVGYAAHKTFSSVRVVQLTATQAACLRSRIQKLKLCVGDQVLLMRCDGSREMGLRDHRLANDFGSALKQVTGEPVARFHSKRAATIESKCWPGWEELVSAKMQGNVDPRQCHDWVKSLQLEWVRTAYSATTAGHADLRSVIGNYLAVWPLVFAVSMGAKLSELEPGPKLIRQLGLSATAQRQTKSRTTFAGNIFSVWGWVFGQLNKKLNQKPIDKAAPGLSVNFSIDKAHIDADQPTVSHIDSLRYLMVRALGLPQDLALEKTHLPLSQAIALDALLSGRPELYEVARRARSDAKPRAVKANVELALSESGTQIIEWMLQLRPKEMTKLKCALFRQKACANGSAASPDFWMNICNCMPKNLAIHIKLGPKVANGKLLAELTSLVGTILVDIDQKIGEQPVISIQNRGQENRVLSSRLSAVVRAASLGTAIFLQRNELDEN